MDITIQFISLIPVVLGVTQVLKIFGVKERILPLIAIVLGVAGVMALGTVSGEGVIQGIIVGLAASGLWSGTKNSFEGISVKVGMSNKRK